MLAPAPQLRLHDPSAALLASWRAPLASRLSATVVAGPALHIALLRGQADRLAITRFSPQLYAGVRLHAQLLERFIVGVWLGASLSLLTQNYWVGDELVLSSRRVSFMVALALGVPITL